MKTLKSLTFKILPIILLFVWGSPAFAGSIISRVYAFYGAQTTFYFTFEDISDAEAPFTGTAPVAADIWVSKNGGAPANATNAMTAVGNGIYSWVATASEMQAATVVVSVYDATASAIFKPAALLIETQVNVSQLNVDASTMTNSNAATFTGSGTGNGAEFLSGTGANGAALRLEGRATNAYGLEVVGKGGSAGIHAIGGAQAAGMFLEGQGVGEGLSAKGGSGGSGAKFHAGATSATSGFYVIGDGTGPGFRADGGTTSGQGAYFVGGGTGVGVQMDGGSTSGTGLYARAVAGAASAGALFTGSGSSAGFETTGGDTGPGVYFAGGNSGGSGLYVRARAGNADGFIATGSGTKSGIAGTGGATGSGAYFEGGTSSGYGIYNTAQTAAQYNNLFSLPYTDLTGAPVAGTTSIREGLGALIGRFYNKVTQTATTQTIYKTDSTTVAATCTTSDNGTTQTKGKCN